MNLTYEELLTIECVLVSILFDCNNRIVELESGTLTENYKKEQLEQWQKNQADYSALLEKIRKLQRTASTAKGGENNE